MEISIPTREDALKKRENAFKVAVEELSDVILEEFQAAYNLFYHQNLDSRFFFRYDFFDVSSVAGFTTNQIVHHTIISVLSTLSKDDHDWTFSFKTENSWNDLMPCKFDSFKEENFEVISIAIRESYD